MLLLKKAWRLASRKNLGVKSAKDLTACKQQLPYLQWRVACRVLLLIPTDQAMRVDTYETNRRFV